MLRDDMLRAAIPAMKSFPEHNSAALKIGFWIAIGLYVLCPLVFAVVGTSSLSYRADANERFVPALHEPLKTENRCHFDDCDDVPVAWRDRQSGAVYTEADFRDHRREEYLRLGASWFIYGAIGCILAAWYRQQFFGERLAASLAMYLLGNVVLVGTLLLNMPA